MLLVRCADSGWLQRVAIGTPRAAWGRGQRLGCGSEDLRVERTPEGWPHGMNRVQDRRQLSEKGRPGVEVYSGDDWSRDLGGWVKRTTVIDRLADRYHERVVDPDTGGVLHEKVKPLSEHHRVMAVITPPPEPPPLDSQEEGVVMPETVSGLGMQVLRGVAEAVDTHPNRVANIYLVGQAIGLDQEQTNDVIGPLHREHLIKPEMLGGIVSLTALGAHRLRYG